MVMAAITFAGTFGWVWIDSSKPLVDAADDC